MSDKQKIKVSELPEDEQKALIQEAYSLGIHSVLTGWKVETLKKRIETEKAKRESNGDNEQNAEENEQNSSNDEQNTEETEQNGSNDERVEGDNDDKKDDEPTDEPAEDEPKSKETPQEPKQEPKQESAKPKKGIFNGICHICGSRVIDGVCTGCKFIR